MKPEEAIEIIITEFKKAEIKFPSWPDDIVHAACILGEEAGELLKAALDRFYGRSDSDDEMIKEAAQTGAMVLRFLRGLTRPTDGKDEIRRQGK